MRVYGAGTQQLAQYQQTHSVEAAMAADKQADHRHGPRKHDSVRMHINIKPPPPKHVICRHIPTNEQLNDTEHMGIDISLAASVISSKQATQNIAPAANPKPTDSHTMNCSTKR